MPVTMIPRPLAITSLLAVAGLLAACASGPARTPEPTERRTVYDCSNGEVLELRLQPQGSTALLVRKGGQVSLEAEPSGSGFRYGKGPITVHGKGPDLLLEIGRMTPVRCVARPEGAPTPQSI